jgi:hypothetical protein
MDQVWPAAQEAKFMPELTAQSLVRILSLTAKAIC